jgi:glycosyltransferase involved in cell wall biosynthesis
VSGLFPRLLVVTDADLAPNSRGAGRTLLNILSGWAADDVRVLTPNLDAPERDPHGHRIVHSGGRLAGGLVERLKPWLGDVQAQFTALRPLEKKVIEGFDPEVLLIVPIDPHTLVLGSRWASRLSVPSATWLMDDWVQQYPARWLTGSAAGTARSLLARNAGWLVISEYLGEELRTWTNLERPRHVVHNAVPIGETPEALSTPRSGRFVLRYAGTIWPMHADALTLLARAVALRRAAGDDIVLVFHTDETSWKRNEAVWNETGTLMGGLVPYDGLRQTLADSDLLVVAASFAPEHARMSRSSVQTKITDYLASGRAILSVGPEDGACTRFLRERAIGVYIDADDVHAAVSVLRRAISSRPALAELAMRGWEVARRDHEVGAVSLATAAFLKGLKRPG